MKKLPQFNLSDEAEMRAFYASCGVSESTIEAAIKARRNKPIDKEEKPSLPRGRRPKSSRLPG